MNSDIVISTGGSSSRLRICATTQPTARPIATPPAAASTKSSPASMAEKLPPTAAEIATR